MIVYLIGTNHAHQLVDQKHGNSKAFTAYLSEFCLQKEIDLIAEELNEEAIVLWKAKGSVAKEVASNISVPHLFCDPSPEDRREIGILTDQEIAEKLGFGKCLTPGQELEIEEWHRKKWPVREKYWLDQL